MAIKLNYFVSLSGYYRNRPARTPICPRACWWRREQGLVRQEGREVEEDHLGAAHVRHGLPRRRSGLALDRRGVRSRMGSPAGRLSCRVGPCRPGQELRQVGLEVLHRSALVGRHIVHRERQGRSVHPPPQRLGLGCCRQRPLQSRIRMGLVGRGHRRAREGLGERVRLHADRSGSASILPRQLGALVQLDPVGNGVDLTKQTGGALLHCLRVCGFYGNNTPMTCYFV